MILLPQGKDGDLAIGDVTLGVYAIVSGARTLAQYLDDMRTRPLDLAKDVQYEPQSPERIAAVEKALQPLKDFTPVAAAEPAPAGGTEKKTAKKEPSMTEPEPRKKTGQDWKV